MERPAATIQERSAFTAIGEQIDRYSPNFILACSLVTILFLGTVDYATGPEVAFSIFYLIPISVVAWKVGARRAIAAAALSAGIWLVADLAADQSYSYPLIPVWNTATRLGVFLLVVGLLRTLRDALIRQQTLAQLDSLTGVLNGRAFTVRAQTALSECAERRQPISLAYIDVDDFKSVNNRLGHSGGDDILRALATSLDTTTRSTDVVGRLGGDEFGILLPCTDSEATQHVMESLIARVESSLQNVDVPVSFSAGAVTFLVPPGSIDDMVNTADNLMYETKRAGKAGFRLIIVGADMPQAVPDRGGRRRVHAGR